MIYKQKKKEIFTPNIIKIIINLMFAMDVVKR